MHDQLPKISNILSLRIGNGQDTLFWHHNWIGGSKLCDKFHRLYALESDKLCKLSDRLSINGWCWSWRRNIRSGAEAQQFSELSSTIDHVTLNDSSDKWVCTRFPKDTFSVSGFRSLFSQDVIGNCPTHWCKFIPPNINFFLWRARLNRLPDNCNLLERGVQSINLLCSSCSINVEDTTHIFFECEIAMQVWSYISSWLDITLPVWDSMDGLMQWIMTFFNRVRRQLL
ncbi:uncharacterized protein [Rutidosis leptorrhynchoides]|uniref:uncharacterized protein n=1 Tax=Rutidosis leptorrhynchoides TaxID=125765 RepID=UPI003A9A3644